MILVFWPLLTLLMLRSIELREGGLVDCFLIGTIVAEAFSSARVEVVGIVVII